jgi:2-polyprenyl-6-methoxyphenol hydroxylase-like FAD-dependent oxidoreductase
MARMPAWQLDRSVVDEEVLRCAVAAGAALFRPAKALRIELRSGGLQTVHLEDAAGKRLLTARWVVDASGFATMLARQEGWFRRNDSHPTTAVWARWQGVKDWDGAELAQKFPEWFHACKGIRGTATNHLVGDGWWSWWIPLKGGDWSIGVVFDQRRVRWAGGGNVGARLKEFLLEHHPIARELLAEAAPVEGDVKWRANLPYSCDRVAGDGFALVGDAAGFIDPFYSPGMDWLSFTATRTAELIVAERGGENGAALAGRIAAQNRDFARSYARWFDAIYRDKYDYVGDFELMRVAFHLDLALYYIGVVSQPVKRGPAALREPVFSLPRSETAYRLMKLYNRRLARMARERRARGVFGRMNAGERFLLNGFLPDHSTGKPVLNAVMAWLVLEAKEGWRTWFAKEEAPRPILNSRTAAA